MPVFEASVLLPREPSEVFARFIQPSWLVSTAPPELSLRLIEAPSTLHLGARTTIAGRRWGIEESFAIAKSETGLDEHQVRLWRAWYRHAILSMLAAAFLAAMRARLPAYPTAWQAG